MKKPSIFCLALLFIACSSDSEEPEIINQPDDEVVMEEEIEEEESFTFPFGVSVILKEFSNPVQREGQFYSVNFTRGQSQPSEPLNLSQIIGLDLDASIIDNGQNNVLLFVQKSGTAQKEYLTYNFDTQRIYVVNRTELLLPSDSCFFDGTHIGANTENIWAFNYDLCPDVDGLVLFVQNYDSGLNSNPLILDSAYTGDSFHRIWATDEYFYAHFDSFDAENPEGFVGDGLIVYDANSLEVVYETRTPETKIPVVDGDKMILRKGSETMELYDLELKESLFSNQISRFEGPFFEGKISNASIFQNRVGGLMTNGSGAPGLPGVYDFENNSIDIFNSETYSNFFGTTDFPAPDPAREPQFVLFDLESESFVVLYSAVTGGSGSFSNPDFSGLVFMNFNGEILYHHEFENDSLIPELIVRR